MCSAVDISKVRVPMSLWRFIFMQIPSLHLIIQGSCYGMH